jgi:hypothetical protein
MQLNIENRIVDILQDNIDKNSSEDVIIRLSPGEQRVVRTALLNYEAQDLILYKMLGWDKEEEKGTITHKGKKYKYKKEDQCCECDIRHKCKQILDDVYGYKRLSCGEINGGIGHYKEVK